MAGIGEDDMSSAKYYLACVWGTVAFYLLCYGVINGSATALLLFAALTPALIVFIWWMIDRAALERRIKRLEARFEIAAEKRVAMQTDLSEVEHGLEEVKTRVTIAEKIKALV